MDIQGNADTGANEQPEQTQSFQDMRSTIEEKIDDLVFKGFKDRVYDSKEAQRTSRDCDWHRISRLLFGTHATGIAACTQPNASPQSTALAR